MLICRPRFEPPWRTALLLAVAALSACALPAPFTTTEADLVRGEYAPASRARSGGITVAAYNIRFGEDIDGAIADLCADPHLLAADVLLLQEMDPEGCHRIARTLGYDFAYLPAAIHPHHDRLFGNAILARGTIHEPRFVQLPTPGVFSGTGRIAVVAEVNLEGERLTAVSLHASTIMLSQADRIRQFTVLTDSLQAVEGPIVIGGDFNTVTDRDTLHVFRTLRRAGFRRVENTERTIPPRRVIFPRVLGLLDSMFYRDLVLEDDGVVTRATSSDHYPIWAVLRRDDP